MTTPYEEMHKWQLLDRIEDLETAIARFRDLDFAPDSGLDNTWKQFYEARDYLYSLVPEDVSR